MTHQWWVKSPFMLRVKLTVSLNFTRFYQRENHLKRWIVCLIYFDSKPEEDLGKSSKLKYFFFLRMAKSLGKLEIHNHHWTEPGRERESSFLCETNERVSELILSFWFAGSFEVRTRAIALFGPTIVWSPRVSQCFSSLIRVGRPVLLLQ